MKAILTAILAITILESIALFMGYNGTILTTTVAIIAGLAGLATKRPKILRE
ncbi:MAG: hypothetical protein IIC69_03515 [Nanoarchaeota archaeon]|nr:hypothetical protein [Nanoarchaeota archaeon]